MKKEKAWYMDQRAEALAFVYLTRREDLLVHAQTEDHGYDLLVEILRGSRLERRVFAVQVKARTDVVKEISQLGIAYQDWAKISFPLCLFFFAMKHDQAFYTWITEPIITADGHPKLHLNTNGALNNLDNAAVDHIVDQVDHWYDALIRELAA